MPAVSLRHLSKWFGRLTVLDGIDLEVPEGSIYGLLGLNGAGKTTLLRVLMGFLHPGGGVGTVLGRPLGKLTAGDRARIAYVPDRPAFYEHMRVGELVHFVGALHPRWDPSAARHYVDVFELPRERKIGALSTGMRTQFGLALALSTQPELLVLDEPASGLDPVHRRRYLQVLLEASAQPGRTVLLTSQDLGLVEQTCDHFALIHERRIQVAGPITEILESQRRMVVQAPPATGDALRSLPGVRRVRDGAHGFLVTGTALPDEVRRVAGVRAVQAEGLSLEDLFWSYVET